MGSPRPSRQEWQDEVCKLIVDGELKRGHLLTTISAEALRDVGFIASELLASGFVLPTLREGGYTAAELRKEGLKELEAVGFTCCMRA